MNKRAGLVISVVTVMASVAVCELILRLFFYIPDPYEVSKTTGAYIPSQFKPHLRLITQPEQGAPGVHGQNLFTTNNMGFRGDHLAMPKPADEYRIFLLGGSAAECLLLDDSQAINKVLQDELGSHLPSTVKVYNAGKSGDRTYDHIAMMVHRIVHLEPDMVIVFAGVNDLTASIYNADYLHYTSDGAARHFSLAFLLKMVATEFHIGRRGYYLAASFSRKTDKQILETITLHDNISEKIALRKSVPVSKLKPRTDPLSYRNNLETLVGIARAHNIRLVFMTQPSTWNSSVDQRTKDWHWLLYRNGITFDEVLMDGALDSLNHVMAAVSTEKQVPLYDLAQSIPKSMDFFIDDVHFNVRGAFEVGRALASYIVASNLIALRGTGQRDHPTQTAARR